MRRSVLTVFGLMCVCSAAGAQTLESGFGKFTFQDRAITEGRPIDVWHFRPQTYEPESKILFVMHGMSRNARDSCRLWAGFAHRSGTLIVAPEFSQQHFTSAAYNQGNLRNDRGKPNSSSKTAFRAVEVIFDEVLRRTNSTRRSYALFGHSAGGQFVHRMVLFGKSSRIELAIAANSGWYTVPNRDALFPYALKGWRHSSRQLKQSFAIPLVVLLGEADTQQDVGLRQTEWARRQGRNRLERGRFFYAEAEQAAQRLNVPFAWRLQTIPGIGHNFLGMAQAAERWLVTGDSASTGAGSR